MRACPADTAYVSVTSTWHSAGGAGGAAVPAGRAGAADRRLHVGGLVHDQDRVVPVPGTFPGQLSDGPVRAAAAAA